MRLFAWVFLVIAPLAANTPPPWEWRWSNPQPTGNNLIHVFFSGPSHGILVADNGETLATPDAGETWTARAGRIPANVLVDASTLDGVLLLGAAVDGKIWKSTDGGGSWKNTASTTVSLMDIAQPGGKVALAVGARGTIVRSEDDGETWAKVRSDSVGNQLFGIHCGKDGFALAAGDFGTLLKSRDTGKTWITLPKPPTEPHLTSLAFSDTARGFATTVDGRLIETADGGLSWKSTALDTLAFLRGIRLDGRNLTVTSSEGSLWKSNDGGATWKRSDADTPYFLAAAAMAGPGQEFIVGNAGTVLKSTDAGKTWAHKQVGTTQEVLGLATLAPGTWVAFGSEGLIYKTTDGGKSWSPKASPIAARFLSGSFAGRLGLLGGYGGTLLRSADAGETWAPATVPAGLKRMFGVAWCDTSIALAVGDSGVVLRSVDGGRKWDRVPAIPGLTDQTLSAVACRASGAAYAVGYQGRILKSIDRGASWKSIPTGAVNSLYGFSFYDDSVGMAVGANGIVLVTRDAGEHWTRETTGSNDDFAYGAVWLGRDTAVIVSDWVHYSKTYLTGDGGKSWEELPNPTSNLFWAIAGADSGQVAIMGQAGTILLGKPVRAPVGIRKVLARAESHDGFRASRMGSLPLIKVTFTPAFRGRVGIEAYDLEGRFLREIYRGEGVPGKVQSLWVPFAARGAAVLRLTEGGRGGKARHCLLSR